MTRDILRLASPAIPTQQSHVFAGQISLGPASLKRIKLSPRRHTIDITLTVSCVRSSATEAIMEESLSLSLLSLDCQLMSSRLSNQSISLRSLHTRDGNSTSPVHSQRKEF